MLVFWICKYPRDRRVDRRLGDVPLLQHLDQGRHGSRRAEFACRGESRKLLGVALHEVQSHVVHLVPSGFCRDLRGMVEGCGSATFAAVVVVSLLYLSDAVDALPFRYLGGTCITTTNRSIH